MSITENFEAPGDKERSEFAVGLVQNHVSSLNGVRVLDLACRTGAFSRAFAERGAITLGIEGKAGNYDKIPFIPTHHSTFHLDDVRNLSVAKYGKFDVTLCLGLLYHLGTEDALNLLRAMRSVTTLLAVIDTHYATEAPDIKLGTDIVNGVGYTGRWFNEEPPSLWSSLGNSRAWWFTKESLEQACHDTGWETVEFVNDVTWSGLEADRQWLLVY